jgi:hypothetical protein
MEWLQQYWQIVSVIAAQIGYQIKHNFRIENKVDKHVDSQTLENLHARERLSNIEDLLKSGKSATCQVHTSEIEHIHKRLDKLEERR